MGGGGCGGDHKRLLQLYNNKLDNSEETHKFLEIYSLPRLNHEKIKTVNYSKDIESIQSVIKHLSTKESSSTDGFTREFHQHLKTHLQSFSKS